MTSVTRCPVAHVAVVPGDDESFRRSHEQLILDNAGDAFVAIDEAGTVLEWNREAERIYGYAAADAIGRDIADLIIPVEYRDDHHRGVAGYIRRGRGQVAGQYIELEARHASGRIFPIEMAFWGLRGDHQWYFYSFGRDITERKAREAERDYAARHDVLTGVANRSVALASGAQALARAADGGSSVAVLTVVVDRFKVLRRVLGHDAADQLLREVATRIGAIAGDRNLTARIGEDEFAVLMPHITSEQDGRRLAEDIAERVSGPVAVAGDTIEVAVTVAVVPAGAIGETMDEMLRDASAGTQLVRRADGAQVAVIDDALRRTLRDRLDRERELAGAVAGDQLRLHYQPVLAADGHIVGVEALVRWQHPDRGLLAPGDFIDIAEESGLIVSIGEWVLREAAHQAELWRRAGIGELSIAVNLSARQFSQADLVATVADVIAGHDLRWNPVGLHLEVTESLLMSDPDAAIRSLADLKELGVGLSIDDFGTGYSSLAYLRSFPMDIVKIDRSFVIDVATDPVDRAIVRAIVDLAHATGKTVLAEGIEDADQHESLLDLGVDAFQGYYFGRPQPAVDLTASLQAHTRQPVI